MCFGGGDRAAEAAQRQEQERQRQIRMSTAAIDNAYIGREAQYGDFLNALREQYMSDAGRQKAVADRNLKFSLARSGLTGGSADADQKTLLGDEYARGTLRAEQTAQSKLSDLMSADAASKANLIALAQGGADSGTAAQQAASTLRSNISGARSEGLAADIGDIFGGTADLWRRSEEAAERRRGLRDSQVYANPFSRDG